ncbi:hypothetical protein QWY86_15560 [Pedobacter aquatilis]|uniref:hypothetical protein n=1 Tax=Pedobacter aquatilis TaxID=351343 RepID=UPI0025B2EA8A|nr:hypothetical protein [Pedobacter aquatilis]MDN3588100.1 hypothetical protein [Pedobacter aquatilis]
MRRKIILLSLSLCYFAGLQAQTNVFPSTGNVGVGTLTPENIDGWDKVLDVYGNTHAKLSVRSSNVSGGFWSHFQGYYGAPAGSMAGTLTNHPFSIITSATPRFTAQTNGNIGIGTINPSSLLELSANNDRLGLTMSSNGNESAYADMVFSVKDRLYDSPQRVHSWIVSHRKDGYFSGNPTGQSSLEFYSVMNNGAYAAPLSFKSNGDLILASTRNAIGGNVGIGTNFPDAKLAVNGLIHAREVKVDLQNWPDYVFDDKYRKSSLAELEHYIKTNKHLPGMPTASKVEKEGIELGAMNKLLLEKVEELTLHLIEKDKELIEVKAAHVNSKSEQAKLQEFMADLLKRVQILEKNR